MMNDPPLMTTYQELCSNPDRNPLGEGPGLIEAIEQQYLPWAIGQVRRDLLDNVLMDTGIELTGGIGVMVDDDDHMGGTLQVLHSIYKHTGLDTHRGKFFATIGDIQGIDAEIVEFKEELLDATLQVVVAADPARHSAIFEGDEAMKLAPATATEGADTRKIKVRKSTFIPFSLLPFVLDKNLTPRQAYETLVPVIQAQGLEQVCQPLLDFLIASSTRRHGLAAGDNSVTVTVRDTAGVSPARLLPVIRERRDRLLFVHLPDLKPQPGIRSDPALLGIMSAMKDISAVTKEDTDDRRVDRERTARPKTIEEKWPAYAGRLCKLCGASSWEDLPAYWHDAAAHKKGDGVTPRSLLQDQVDLAANELGVPPPLVTVQHTTTVTNWLFSGSTEFNLGGGLLPFTVTPPGAVSINAMGRHEQDHEDTADYTLVMGTNSSMTAADARSLRGNNTYVPMDMEEAESMLESYTALLGATLGVNHPNVISHQRSLKEYRSVRPHLKKILSDRLGPRLASATIVYYYHVKHRYWFKRQWDIAVTQTLPPPDLSHAFKTFAEGYNLSWLPNTDHVDVLSKLARPKEVPPPGTPRGRPLPGAAAQVTPEPGTPQRTRVRNNNRDPRLFDSSPLAVKLKAIRIKDLIARSPDPPLITGGEERCLTWHLKGACYDDCYRSADHVAMSKPDKDKLFAWAKANVE